MSAARCSGRGLRRQSQQVLVVVEPAAGLSDLQRFAAAIAQEGAEIGALITQQEPDEAMRATAQAAGDYVSPWSGARYAQRQLLPVDRLTAGETIAYPRECHPTLRVSDGSPGLKSGLAPEQGCSWCRRPRTQ
jgi:hypothetical protein